ncbi:hypothetical protein OKW96_14850 [Sphingobacterium sp. KU25419]|nr:hypothetical protein OKW96_14850 [Sphingobacterium sp. KU25419]
MKIEIKSSLPDKSVAHFVHSFWMVESSEDKEIPLTVLPHGMVDLSFMKINSGNWNISLRGIDTILGSVTLPANTKIFSIGFKLLAAEYLFGDSVKVLLNKEINLPNDFGNLKKVT